MNQKYNLFIKSLLDKFLNLWYNIITVKERN